MTRKHYEKIAKILCEYDAKVVMTMELMGFFEKDNPNFDRSKFARVALGTGARYQDYLKERIDNE